MPSTSVGSAKGRSTKASTIFLPGNRYRTKTHATSRPKPALIPAAMSDAPNVSRYDASTRGDVTASTNAGHVMVAVFKNVAPSGNSTIRPRYSMVYPSVRRKPGRALRSLEESENIRGLVGLMDLRRRPFRCAQSVNSDYISSYLDQKNCPRE